MAYKMFVRMKCTALSQSLITLYSFRSVFLILTVILGRSRKRLNSHCLSDAYFYYLYHFPMAPNIRCVSKLLKVHAELPQWYS